METPGAQKVDLLRRIPLFAEFSPDELAAVAQTTAERAVKSGDVVMRQGEPGQELVLIVDGTAAVERNGKQLPVRRAGDFVGELALVTGRPRSATITALTDLRLVTLDHQEFHRLLRTVPTIATKMLIAVCERLPADEV